MRERDREKLQQLRTQIKGGAQATQSAADPVERLLDELRSDPALNRVELTSNFLNDVGYVLERDGFGAVEAYLLDRAQRQDVGPQARFVLNNVMSKLRACPPIVARRALGRCVIKILLALQQEERSEVNDQGASFPRGGRGPGASSGGRRP